MKINLIFFISNFSFGGAGNSIVKLCEALDKNKYSISIICLGKSGYKNILIKNNIKLFEINRTKLLFSLFKLTKIINNLISKNKKNILISNIHYNNTIILLLKRFFKPIKIIIVERTPIEELNIYFNLIDFIKKNVLKFLVKYVYNRADLVIANSNGIRHGLAKLITKKIRVIYPPSINKIYKNHKIKKKITTAFCVTRLSLEKNIICILRAFNELKNEKLILNIYGNGSEKKKLMLFVNKNNLKNKIFFKGFKRNIDKISDEIYISSSLFEGCGNATIEAINNSKIIISSDCPGGNKEILLNGKGGNLFKNDNEFNLAAIIKKVIRNPKSNYKKTFKAKLKLQRFLLTNNKKKYEKIFSNL